MNSVEDGARRTTAEAARAASARTRAEQALYEVIRSILPALAPEEITGDKHLRDLGADSVDRVEIILGVTRRLGIDEPMSNFSAVPDIDGLVDHLSRGPLA
ncbi:phosphopantetheine-binding protein [Streptomyces sp. SID3212]|uniref:phosphopantetheine-binding protein n=1 Tax=Streptomyces sp. SID3212 TaxID=2690259 RepID=UPI0019261C4D